MLLDFEFELLVFYSTFPACLGFVYSWSPTELWPLSMFVLHLAALSASCVPIVLQFIVRMSNISLSGMPNRACSFPRII